MEWLACYKCLYFPFVCWFFVCFSQSQKLTKKKQREITQFSQNRSEIWKCDQIKAKQYFRWKLFVSIVTHKRKDVQTTKYFAFYLNSDLESVDISTQQTIIDWNLLSTKQKHIKLVTLLRLNWLDSNEILAFVDFFYHFAVNACATTLFIWMSATIWLNEIYGMLSTYLSWLKECVWLGWSRCFARIVATTPVCIL